MFLDRLHFILNAVIYKLLQRNNIKSHFTQNKFAIIRGDDLSLYMAIFGIFEEDILRSLTSKLTDEAKAGICLDVGANLGNHTIYFANFFSAVHAFEPNPDIYPLLLYNTKKIGNVVCQDYGLSNQTQQVQFVEEISNLGKSHIVLGGDYRSQSTSIQVKKFDEIEAFRDADITLIKIDVEGHELEALTGMRNTLIHKKPLIAIEILAENIDCGLSPAINLLSDCGFDEFYEVTRTMYIETGKIPKNIKLALNAILIFFLGLKEPRIQSVDPANLKQKNYDAIVATHSCRDLLKFG